MVTALLAGGKKPEIELPYDPSHSVERRMIEGIVAGAAMQATGTHIFRGGGYNQPFAISSEPLTSKAGATYNGYAHSFGGMGIQFLLMVGVDVGIQLLIRRQQGVWKRMRAAPLSRTVLLGSRAASAAITSTVTLFVLFAFARVVFGVKIEGSMAGFLGLCAAFGLMTAAFGLLVAAFGKTPDATRGLAILVTLVIVMLGGAWVPTFIFPKWLQAITVVIPTRWAMDGLDAVTWRGLGLSAVAPQIALLFASALAFGALAVLRFRWEE
jgi:ABC-2 type transport system permease protein